MPHNREDDRYSHLVIVAEGKTPERRKQTPPPNNFDSDTRKRRSTADRLKKITDSIVEDAKARTEDPSGVKPHLVFKIPLSGKAATTSVTRILERANIATVSLNSDNVIVAFRSDTDLSDFEEVVEAYAKGPKPGVNPQTDKPYASTQWDALEFIDAAQMQTYSASDRIGRRLAKTIGAEGGKVKADNLYVLDVEIWHQSNPEETKRSLAELETLVTHEKEEGEDLCDKYQGQFLCLARVKVLGAKLLRLLNLDVVAEVESPPSPSLDHKACQQAGAQDFPNPPSPPEDGPRLCVVDSGITANHPLLSANVGDSISVLSNDESGADGHGHGTMIAGIATFGDIRQCVTGASFESPITVFSSRVLNSDNLFDDEALILHQIKTSVEHFTKEPYNCRVFNMSLGDNGSWLQHNTKQSLWAEALDIICRDLDVVLVVSSGNNDYGWTLAPDEAEEQLIGYPDFLFEKSGGLCDPATSAISITVGGISLQTGCQSKSSIQADDIAIALANEQEPSPTSRIGPGINDAIKPEFVAEAGNVAFQGYAAIREIDANPGIAVLSLSNEPFKGLFKYDVGTSFAAPQVARFASIVEHELNQSLGQKPSANLIRAVLASGSSMPSPVDQRIKLEHGEKGARRVYGYGAIDEEFIRHSADRRVTLIGEHEMEIDTFSVFEIPAPAEFRQAQGSKTVTVSLAFDPPVRRRRANYLGVKMDFSLIRGKTLDEIFDAYRKLTADEKRSFEAANEKAQGAFQGANKCDLQPGSQALANSTLQKASWTFSRENNDYGSEWYLVVKAKRTWAPESIEKQRFGIAVTLEADEGQLFSLVRNRIRQRTRIRR